MTLEKQIESLQEELNSLLESKKPIDERLIAIRLELIKATDKQIVKKIKLSGDNPDWNFLLDATTDTTIKYQEMNRKLYEIGLQVSGYFPETDQYCIRICLYKDDKENLKKVLAGLEKVIPFIKPLPSKGTKIISIFEETLSEHGSYKLHIPEDGSFVIVRNRYSTPQILETFTDLEKTLEYIMKYHYMEKEVW